MAFGIGTNAGNTNAGTVKGTQKEIACECWFTSTGKMIPLMLKVKDEELSKKLRQIRTQENAVMEKMTVLMNGCGRR